MTTKKCNGNRNRDYNFTSRQLQLQQQQQQQQQIPPLRCGMTTKETAATTMARAIATATATATATGRDLVGRTLFLEQGDDEGEDVVCDDLVAVRGGVGVVALHHAVDAEDAFQ